MTEHAVPKLTAGELAHLWEHYMSNSLASVVLDYFQKIVESDDIRSVCALALLLVNTDKNRIAELYKQENYPVPRGFTEQDVNMNAPKLFTDEFVLYYVCNMAKVDLGITAVALADAVRADIRELFTERMTKTMELHDKTVSLLLEKGLFIRAPYITSTHETQPAAEPSFLASFFSSEQRTLTAREANELHKIVLSNYIGKCFLMGLSQANENPRLRDLMLRGKELSSKIMKEMSDVLIESDLPVPMTWDTHVLDSTVSPFSDKLIAFHIDRMNLIGLANYGYGAAMSARKDLKTLYARIIADVYQYELDVKHLMLDNEWMERPPAALDRRALSEVE